LLISPNYTENAWMTSAVKTAELLAQDHEVMVLTSNVGDYPSLELRNNVKICRMKTLFIDDPVNLAITLGQVKQYKKLVKEFKPDKIIFNKYMFYTSLLTFCTKNYILQTDTYCGKCWFNKSKIMNVVLWLIHHTIGNIMLKRASKVVILHENLIHYSKPYNYEVIHNGVYPEHYDNIKPCKEVIKIKDNKFLITYVGRLDEVKGYKRLLDVSKQFPDCNFLFICGNKHIELQHQINKDYSNVTCINFRDNVNEYLAGTDLYVLPSYAEGLPNTLMEAMSSGLPCIASDVGGVSTLLKTTFNTDEVLVKKIEDMINNKDYRLECGKRNREKIIKDFNLHKIKEGWNELLNNTN